MSRRQGGARLAIHAAEPSQAPILHALITANREEGRLLPRSLEELVVHAERFTIAVRNRTIVGCAELAPLSARLEGFDKLCAFTHAPGYFSRMGFSIVPHLWLPENISADCVACPRFRRCGQYAMVATLEAVGEHLPAASVARSA
jgi:N-acetylglutamate synthase-like GNAT family acetyltransferase